MILNTYVLICIWRFHCVMINWFETNSSEDRRRSFWRGSTFLKVMTIKEQNIGIYGYIGTWILRKYRKYRKISVDILTKISVMQKLTKIL